MFNNGQWARGYHGLMRGMSVQLVDLVGNDGNADGLLDLVLGNICYRNIGTASWPRYHESHKTILRGFDETLPSSSSEYNTVNIATSYHFVDFDQDGDQDAMVTDKYVSDVAALVVVSHVGILLNLSFFVVVVFVFVFLTSKVGLRTAASTCFETMAMRARPRLIIGVLVPTNDCRHTFLKNCTIGEATSLWPILTGTDL